MNADDARAFALSLAHREVTEGAATAAVSGGVIGLRYESELHQPWPRAFSCDLEYVAVAVAVALAREASGCVPEDRVQR